MPSPPSIAQFHNTAYDLFQSRNKPPDPNSWLTCKLPKLNFTTFDGENTRLWISRATSYFEMYLVETAAWVCVASLHCTDNAARWVQSVEAQLKHIDWPTFFTMLHERFGRDQHQLLIRKMFHIWQESTVKDYVDHFPELLDHLASYYTIRFYRWLA